MFKLEKILKQNNITKTKICELIKISRTQLHGILNGKLDFNLQDLKIIKNYLIKENIINFNQDLGELLHEI